MNKDQIMQTDVLDILFENRNKQYGAYALRKFYNNRLLMAVGIMLLAVACLTSLSFLHKRKVTITVMPYIIADPMLTHVTEVPKKPVVQKVQVLKQADQKRYVSNLVIVHNTKIDSIQTLKPTDQISTVTLNKPVSVDPGIVSSSVTTGTNDPVIPVITTVDKTLPIYTADIMPAYPGGMEALRRFLQKNLQNPKDMEPGDLVNVAVQFVVGYDGKLQKFSIIQDGGDAYDNEVLRVLKKMPDWIPGRNNGENISVYYNIPVKFVPAE